MATHSGNPYTLHEAMRLVLREHGGCLHAADLAREVGSRRLYLRHDGRVAQANQLRARASKRRDIFSCHDGSIGLE